MDVSSEEHGGSIRPAAMDPEDFSYDDIDHRVSPLDTTDDQSNMSGLDLYTDMVIRDSEEAALSMAKLEEEKLSFKTQLEQAKAEVDKLSKLNETLMKENQILRNNISVLMKTAKIELQRKDRELKELRELETPGRKTDLDQPARRPRGRRLPKHKRGMGQQLQRQNGFPHTTSQDDTTGQGKSRAREESPAAISESRNKGNAGFQRSSADKTLFVLRHREKESRHVRQAECNSPGDSSNITPTRIGMEVNKGKAKQDNTCVEDVGSDRQLTREKSVKTDACQAKQKPEEKSDSVEEAGVESQMSNDNADPKELQIVSRSDDLRHKLDKKKDLPNKPGREELRSAKSKFEEKSNVHPREPSRNESPKNMSKHLPQDKPSHYSYKSARSSPDRKSRSTSSGRKSQSKDREISPARKSKERSPGDQLKKSRTASPENPSKLVSLDSSSKSGYHSSRSVERDRKSGSKSPGRKSHTKLRDGSPAKQNLNEPSSSANHRKSLSTLLSAQRCRGREKTVNGRAEDRRHTRHYGGSRSNSTHKDHETMTGRNKPSGSTSKELEHKKDGKRDRENRRSSTSVRDRYDGGSLTQKCKPNKSGKSRNTTHEITESEQEISKERLSSIAKEAITRAKATLYRCHLSSSATEHRKRVIKVSSDGHGMREKRGSVLKSSDSSVPEERHIDRSKRKEKSGDRWKRKRIESSDHSDRQLKKHKESIGDDFAVVEEPNRGQENLANASNGLYTYEEGHTVLACGIKSTIECTSSKVTVLQNSVSESIDSTLSDISTLSTLHVQPESPFFAPSVNMSIEHARQSHPEKEENELSEGEIISSDEDEVYHGKEVKHCNKGHVQSKHSKKPKQQNSLKSSDTKKDRNDERKASTRDVVDFDHSSSVKSNDQEPKTEMALKKRSNAELDYQEEASHRIQSNSNDRGKSSNIATKANDEGESSKQSTFQPKNTKDADMMPRDAVTCENNETCFQTVEDENPVINKEVKETCDTHGVEGDHTGDESSNNQRPYIDYESSLSTVDARAETSINRDILYEDLRIDSDSTITDSSVCTVESVNCSENTLTSAGTVKGENSASPFNETHCGEEISEHVIVEKAGTVQGCDRLRGSELCLVADVSLDTSVDPALVDENSVNIPCTRKPAEPQFEMPQETRLSVSDGNQSSADSASPDSDDIVLSRDEITKDDCVEQTSMKKDHDVALDIPPRCESESQKGVQDTDDIMSLIAGECDFSRADSRHMTEEPDGDGVDEEIIVKEHKASDLSIISCQTSTLNWTNPDIHDSSTQVDSQGQPKDISVTRLDGSIGTDSCIPSVCGQAVISGAIEKCEQQSSQETELSMPTESHVVDMVKQNQSEHVVDCDEDVIVQTENSTLENDSEVKGHQRMPRAIKLGQSDPVSDGETATAGYKSKFSRHTESSSSEEREHTEIIADKEITEQKEDKPVLVKEFNDDGGALKGIALSDMSSVQERDSVVRNECAFNPFLGDQCRIEDTVITGVLSGSCVQLDVKEAQSEKERIELGRDKAKPIESRQNYLIGSYTDTSESELDFEEDIDVDEERTRSDRHAVTCYDGDVHESDEIDRDDFDDVASCGNREGSYAKKDDIQSEDCDSDVNVVERASNADTGGDKLPKKDRVRAGVSDEPKEKEASPVNGDEASVSTRDTANDNDKGSGPSEGEISEGEIVSDDSSDGDKPEARIMGADDLRHKLGRERHSKRGNPDARGEESMYCVEDTHKSERGTHRLHGADGDRYRKKRKRSEITRDPIYSRKENSKGDDERILERKKRLLEKELRQIEMKREMIQKDKETRRPARRQQISEEERRRLDRRKTDNEKREERRRENFRRQQEVRWRNEEKQREEHRKISARLEEKERRHESYRKGRRVTDGRKS